MVVLAALLIGLGPYIGQVHKTIGLFKMNRYLYLYLKINEDLHVNHMFLFKNPVLPTSFLASMVTYISPKPL